MTTTQELGPLQRDWIAKLRGGDYAQTTTALHDKDGYCCLGVALEHVLGVEPKHIDGDSGIRFYHDRECSGWARALPDSAVECLGLYSGHAKIMVKHLPKDEQERLEGSISLARMNDSGWSFNEIAAFIEAHPKAVFREPC